MHVLFNLDSFRLLGDQIAPLRLDGFLVCKETNHAQKVIEFAHELLSVRLVLIMLSVQLLTSRIPLADFDAAGVKRDDRFGCDRAIGAFDRDGIKLWCSMLTRALHFNT